MDGVKVTYIETRFVTSDAAGFKDLVQRLTGRSPTATVAPAPAGPPHRPRACRAAAADYCGRSASPAAAAASTQRGYHHHASSPSAAAADEPRVGDGRLATPCLDEATYGVGDFAGLFYGGSASQNAQWGHGGCYSDYFPC